MRIHSDENVSGKKRLYMTATPRIYSEKAKNKVEGEEATLASMDMRRFTAKSFYTKTLVGPSRTIF